MIPWLDAKRAWKGGVKSRVKRGNARKEREPTLFNQASRTPDLATFPIRLRNIVLLLVGVAGVVVVDHEAVVLGTTEVAVVKGHLPL